MRQLEQVVTMAETELLQLKNNFQSTRNLPSHDTSTSNKSHKTDLVPNFQRGSNTSLTGTSSDEEYLQTITERTEIDVASDPMVFNINVIPCRNYTMRECNNCCPKTKSDCTSELQTPNCCYKPKVCCKPNFGCNCSFNCCKPMKPDNCCIPMKPDNCCKSMKPLDNCCIPIKPEVLIPGPTGQYKPIKYVPPKRKPPSRTKVPIKVKSKIEHVPVKPKPPPPRPKLVKMEEVPKEKPPPYKPPEVILRKTPPKQTLSTPKLVPTPPRQKFPPPKRTSAPPKYIPPPPPVKHLPPHKPIPTPKQVAPPPKPIVPPKQTPSKPKPSPPPKPLAPPKPIVPPSKPAIAPPKQNVPPVEPPTPFPKPPPLPKVANFPPKFTCCPPKYSTPPRCQCPPKRPPRVCKPVCPPPVCKPVFPPFNRYPYCKQNSPCCDPCGFKTMLNRCGKNPGRYQMSPGYYNRTCRDVSPLKCIHTVKPPPNNLTCSMLEMAKNVESLNISDSCNHLQFMHQNCNQVLKQSKIEVYIANSSNTTGCSTPLPEIENCMTTDTQTKTLPKNPSTYSQCLCGNLQPFQQINDSILAPPKSSDFGVMTSKDLANERRKAILQRCRIQNLPAVIIEKSLVCEKVLTLDVKESCNCCNPECNANTFFEEHPESRSTGICKNSSIKMREDYSNKYICPAERDSNARNKPVETPFQSGQSYPSENVVSEEKEKKKKKSKICGRVPNDDDELSKKNKLGCAPVCELDKTKLIPCPAFQKNDDSLDLCYEHGLALCNICKEEKRESSQSIGEGKKSCCVINQKKPPKPKINVSECCATDVMIGQNQSQQTKVQTSNVGSSPRPPDRCDISVQHQPISRCIKTSITTDIYPTQEVDSTCYTPRSVEMITLMDKRELASTTDMQSSDTYCSNAKAYELCNGKIGKYDACIRKRTIFEICPNGPRVKTKEGEQDTCAQKVPSLEYSPYLIKKTVDDSNTMVKAKSNYNSSAQKGKSYEYNNPIQIDKTPDDASPRRSTNNYDSKLADNAFHELYKKHENIRRDEGMKVICECGHNSNKKTCGSCRKRKSSKLATKQADSCCNCKQCPQYKHSYTCMVDCNKACSDIVKGPKNNPETPEKKGCCSCKKKKEKHKNMKHKHQEDASTSNNKSCPYFRNPDDLEVLPNRCIDSCPHKDSRPSDNICSGKYKKDIEVAHCTINSSRRVAVDDRVSSPPAEDMYVLVHDASAQAVLLSNDDVFNLSPTSSVLEYLSTKNQNDSINDILNLDDYMTTEARPLHTLSINPFKDEVIDTTHSKRKSQATNQVRVSEPINHGRVKELNKQRRISEFSTHERISVPINTSFTNDTLTRICPAVASTSNTVDIKSDFAGAIASLRKSNYSRNNDTVSKCKHFSWKSLRQRNFLRGSNISKQYFKDLKENLKAATSSDGEAECKCSVSIGEIHNCQRSSRSKKLHSSHGVRKPDVGLHIAGRHRNLFNKNLVSYYISTSSSLNEA